MSGNTGTAKQRMKTRTFLHRAEDTAVSAVLIMLAVVPVIEIILRALFRTGIKGGAEYTAHLVLWITFLGGMVTSRGGQHLAISAGINSTFCQ